MKFPIYFDLILTFNQPQKNVITCLFREVAKVIHDELIFLLAGFSFTSIHNSHDNKGKGRESI